MQKSNSKEIAIIGAGIAGSYLAIILAKEGRRVNVYERLSESDAISANSKRSFNLTFYKYAETIFKKEGMWESLLPNIIKLDGATTYVAKLKKPILSSFSDKLPYYTISRAMLLAEIIKKAKTNKLIKFYFNHKLVNIDPKTRTLNFLNEDANVNISSNAAVVLGADGLNSAVRKLIHEKTKGIVQKIQEPWEYKQILIAKDNANKVGLQNNRMYAWTNSDSVFTAFPQKNGSFSGMLILPKKKFPQLMSVEKVEEHTGSRHNKLSSISKQIFESISNNPTGYFTTLHTSPWYYKDFLCLIGDSAHAILPFYGQGMSAAFGDAEALVEIAKRSNFDWSKTFPQYEDRRKVNMDALGDAACEVFKDYRRNKKAYYQAVYAKFEQILSNLFPQLITPPPFEKIAENPQNTYNITLKYNKQKRILKILGVDILIYTTTQILSLLEKQKNAKT